LPRKNFLPDFAENDNVSRSKTNSGSSEVLVHLALSLACSGDWFEFPKGVGKLRQLLQAEVAVLVLWLSLLLEFIEK
jgi:hypothetical protein